MILSSLYNFTGACKSDSCFFYKKSDEFGNSGRLPGTVKYW
ncbi:hypothetical protein HMPREF1548_05913 [Clostridium sp. KLE 1755]|nr:hypothetical protein HMPREF1548_05913 [Clostridium sp. KLE 1755]